MIVVTIDKNTDEGIKTVKYAYTESNDQMLALAEAVKQLVG